MDKITIQSTPLGDDEFSLKSKNVNYYYQGEPSSSYDDILFRMDLGIPYNIQYSSSQEEGFLVERPLSLMPSQQGMALIPLGMTAQINTVVLKNQHIVFHGITTKEAADSYLQGTSGIQIAKGA